MFTDEELQAVDEAAAHVMSARGEAHDKWGQQTHDYEVWNLVLTEEVGEFAKSVLSLRAFLHSVDDFGYDDPGLVADVLRVRMRMMRDEAAQIGGVALAIIEAINRELSE